MKAYKLFLSLGACLFLTTGCYDLDVYPEDELSSGTFFKTEDHARQAMMGVYSLMQNEAAFGRQYSFDCLGGVGAGRDPYGFEAIARGTYTSSESLVSDKFKAFYEGISRANIVLQNVDNCEMTDELKTQYKAEARFMRALYYFYLLDLWGGVPLYDETTVVSADFMNMLKPRSTEDEVREFIIKDLDAAIASLPKEWESADKGRATCGAAMALKGKLYLYNKQYGEALECFKKIAGEPGEVDADKYATYALYTVPGDAKASYADLFKPADDGKGADDCSEMIFTIQNLGGVGQDYGMPMGKYMGSRSTYGSCWHNVMVSTNMADSYETKDGQNYDYSTFQFDWNAFTGSDYTGNAQIRESIFYCTLNKAEVEAYPTGTIQGVPALTSGKSRPFEGPLVEMYEEERDPRMSVSLICPYTYYLGAVNNKPQDMYFAITKSAPEPADGWVKMEGGWLCYLWRKFVPEGDMNGLLNNREDVPINFPLIRLADVYLMMAECYNELDDLDNAVKYVNKVRDRVGMPLINGGDAWMSVTTKEEMFKRIKHERAVELAAEGHSFSDMRRWGVLEEVGGPVQNIMRTSSKYDRVVRERDYLWPIPQTEMDINPNLKGHQNPGW